jgi:hypothetical protein
MIPKALSAALVLLAALTAAAGAEDRTGPNVDPAGTGTRGGVAQMMVAQDLFALGMAQGDALTVLAAARLAAGVDLTDVTRTPETTTAGGVTEEPDVAAGPVGAETMLTAARVLAGEDEVLTDLVYAAEAAAAAPGRSSGASRTPGLLSAGATHVWKVPFYGSSYAELAVLGDGDGTLEVQVADENGNIVCIDVSGADRSYCDFVPAWNGYFLVTVRNAGTKPNSYDLLTN